MSPPERRLVLDASVVIEILAGSPAVKQLVTDVVEGRLEAYVPRLGLVEALYVTCRLWGAERARERLRALLDSEMLEIVEDTEVWELAAECKCRVPVSLGDCYTLATAKKLHVAPLFLRPERELEENMDRIVRWLGHRPLYLLDAPGARQGF